jgi:hypothetical protein
LIAAAARAGQRATLHPGAWPVDGRRFAGWQRATLDTMTLALGIDAREDARAMDLS